MEQIELFDALVDDTIEVIDRAYDYSNKLAKKTFTEGMSEELKKENIKHSYRKKLQKELSKSQLEESIENLKKEIEASTTLSEKLEKQKELRKKEAQSQNAKAMADKAANIIGSQIDKLQQGITQAAKTYSGFVDRIQTRLFGANETYSSITDKMTKVFGASPFFQMQKVMEQVATAVEKGITFNVEARASMAILSDKVAKTFEAFDSTLLRLIKIQQKDSTQARLGMESMLTEFLNSQYQDISYLNNLSKTVTSNLLEASARKGDASGPDPTGTSSSVEFEYAVQKWMGALSSSGASDNLIQQLSTGLGYLGSGNISALSSNQQLEQLLVSAANRGGANYGDMLTQGIQIEDVGKLATGLSKLVKEIASTDNIVALNQYAQVFGMTISDIQSVVNAATTGMEKITGNLVSYADLIKRVEDETTYQKLYSRTGGATLGDNMFQNFVDGAGKGIGSSIAKYLSWEVAGMLSGFLQGIETGLDIQPFGVGTHMNLSVGDLMKVATVTGGSIAGIASMMQGISSLGGVNLGAMVNEEYEVKSKGKLTTLGEGVNRSYTQHVGDYSESALATSSNALTDKAAAQHSDQDFDEEKRKMEKTQKSLSELGDNVKFIVEMLARTGIIIKGRVGTVPENIFSDLANSGSILHVVPGA